MALQWLQGGAPGSLQPWLRDQLQVAQEALASSEQLPGEAIEASYGGVMVQADVGIRGERWTASLAMWLILTLGFFGISPLFHCARVSHIRISRRAAS